MRKAVLVCWMAITWVSAQETTRVFRIHPIGVADPETVRAMAASMVSSGSRVVVDDANGRLLAYATESEHHQLAQLAQALSAPPALVRIEVRRRARERVGEQRADVDVRGGVVLGPDGVRGGGTIRPSVFMRSSEGRDEGVQHVTVASGRRATLEVGETVPYLSWFQQVATHWGLVGAAEIAWERVGAFLSVEPLVIGTGDARRIRIRIVPELAERVGDSPRRVRFERVATEVIAAPGETVRIGSSGAQREFFDRFLIGTSAEGRQYSVEFDLTAQIVELGPRSEGR